MRNIFDAFAARMAALARCAFWIVRMAGCLVGHLTSFDRNQATHSAARDWALGGSAAHRCGTWHCSAGQPAGTGRDWALKCPHLVRDWHSSAFDHTGT